ncbi:hypothetical protein GW17_00061972 [Ensete ventricosum]|nr:hypothetical protein GW17_00061972 [Ensete ventricosum]
MGNRTSLLEAEIGKLKTEGDPELLIVARQWVDELQADNAKLRSGLDELTKQRAERRKVDYELLKLMRENEFLKAELLASSTISSRYRVALARYPDLEVDNNPFTEQPEDSSVCKDVSALSDRFDDSVWTLPGWCQFTPSSSWVTYLGLAQYEIARGHLPRTYFAVVKSYDDFLICEFPEVRLSSNRSKFSRSCASEVSFS